MDIDGVELVILFDGVYFTLSDDRVSKHFVLVGCLEDLVVANIDLILFRNCELFQVDVCLFVVPLDDDHGPVGVLGAAPLRKYLADPTYDGTLLCLPEKHEFPNAVDHTQEHKFLIHDSLEVLLGGLSRGDR